MAILENHTFIDPSLNDAMYDLKANRNPPL